MSINTPSFSPFQNVVSPESIIDIREKFEDHVGLIQNHHFLTPGKILHDLDGYSDHELYLIHEDLLELDEQVFFSGATRGPCYLATAGAPGSGKTTLLENCLDEPKAKGFVHIDPDNLLKRMERTYEADVMMKRRSPKEAYHHWRSASNFIANLFLALGLKHNFAIAHGTTLTSPHIAQMLKSITSVYDYQIALLHLTCEESIRVASKRHRERLNDFHCTAVDFKNKLILFHDRLPDYLNCAQKIDFFYRSHMCNTHLVAEKRDDVLVVLNRDGWNRSGEIHDALSIKGDWQAAFFTDDRS